MVCVFREREEPPRFARPGTFEFEYAKRWKSLDEMEKQQRQQVEKNMREAREKLESEMEDAYHEHQANLLRQGKFRYGRPAILIICYICHSLDVGYPTAVNVMRCVFIQIC